MSKYQKKLFKVMCFLIGILTFITLKIFDWKNIKIYGNDLLWFTSILL